MASSQGVDSLIVAVPPAEVNLTNGSRLYQGVPCIEEPMYVWGKLTVEHVGTLRSWITRWLDELWGTLVTQWLARFSWSLGHSPPSGGCIVCFHKQRSGVFAASQDRLAL